MYFAGFDKVINRMSAVGMQKSPQQLVDAMIRQLPDEYSMQQAILQNQRDLTRLDVEITVGNAYTERIARQSTQPAAAASQSHALFLGGFQPGCGGRHGDGNHGRGRGHQRRWRFAYGGFGDPGRPHGKIIRGRRRRRWRPQPRHRLEGHCDYCGQPGHIKRGCILALQANRQWHRSAPRERCRPGLFV